MRLRSGRKKVENFRKSSGGADESWAGNTSKGRYRSRRDAVGKFTRDSYRLFGRSGQGEFPSCGKAGMIILHRTDII